VEKMKESNFVRIEWLQYWIVYAIIDYIYEYLNNNHIQFSYVPLWYHFKLLLIVCIQLPLIPFNAKVLYQNITVFLQWLDFPTVNHDICYNEKTDNNTNNNKKKDVVHNDFIDNVNEY